MIWMIILSFIVGSLVGTILMACCAINRKEDTLNAD